jgi:hypothetical protein
VPGENNRRGDNAGDSDANDCIDADVPPIVSFLMLGVAAVLSIFKPWRRTPWSHEAGSALAKE